MSDSQLALLKSSIDAVNSAGNNELGSKVLQKALIQCEQYAHECNANETINWIHEFDQYKNIVAEGQHKITMKIIEDAVMSGDTAVVAANMDEVDTSCSGPALGLMVVKALGHNTPACVLLLLDGGADVSVKNGLALMLAVRNEHVEIASRIVDKLVEVVKTQQADPSDIADTMKKCMDDAINANDGGGEMINVMYKGVVDMACTIVQSALNKKLELTHVSKQCINQRKRRARRRQAKDHGETTGDSYADVVSSEEYQSRYANVYVPHVVHKYLVSTYEIDKDSLISPADIRTDIETFTQKNKITFDISSSKIGFVITHVFKIRSIYPSVSWNGIYVGYRLRKKSVAAANEPEHPPPQEPANAPEEAST